MKNSIKLNGLLNVIKKCCNIILPLFIFPYISRVLGPTNYGKYSFANSIVTYFMLAALLGVETYAVREGARIRNDRKKIDQFISEVFSINLLSMVISMVVMFIIIGINGKLNNYKDPILILSLMIPCAVLGREYINIIFEDYIYITVRYIVIQIIGLIAIYVFVKNPEDYLVYTIIYMLTNSLGYIINLVYTHKYCSFKITRRLKLKKHLIPILILFCGQLAITIYVQSDITMLGIFQSDKEVGIYTITSKVYMLIKGMVNALTTVAIPRISYYLGEHKMQEYENFSNKLLNYIILLLVPLTLGLILFSNNILYIIGGERYMVGNQALNLLSLSLLFAVISGFLCNGIMISNRKEKDFLFVTALSAILNIILNLFFIPKVGMLGAAITTLISEILVFFLALKATKKYLKIKIDKQHIFSILIAGVVVVIISIICKKMMDNIIEQLVIAMILSCIAYFGVLAVLRNKIVIDTLNLLFSRK